MVEVSFCPAGRQTLVVCMLKISCCPVGQTPYFLNSSHRARSFYARQIFLSGRSTTLFLTLYPKCERSHVVPQTKHLIANIVIFMSEVSILGVSCCARSNTLFVTWQPKRQWSHPVLQVRQLICKIVFTVSEDSMLKVYLPCRTVTLF